MGNPIRTSPSGDFLEGAASAPAAAHGDVILIWDNASRVWKLASLPSSGGGSVAPLSSIFYVDAGTAVDPIDQDGSIGAPFSTIAFAIAAAATAPIVNFARRATLLVAPGDYTSEGTEAFPTGYVTETEIVALGNGVLLPDFATSDPLTAAFDLTIDGCSFTGFAAADSGGTQCRLILKNGAVLGLGTIAMFGELVALGGGGGRNESGGVGGVRLNGDVTTAGAVTFSGTLGAGCTQITCAALRLTETTFEAVERVITCTSSELDLFTEGEWNRQATSTTISTAPSIIEDLAVRLYVDGNRTVPHANGTAAAPFVAIQDALDAIAAAGPGQFAIEITPLESGPSYGENLAIPGGSSIAFLFLGSPVMNGVSGDHVWTLTAGASRLVFRDGAIANLTATAPAGGTQELELYGCVAGALVCEGVRVSVAGTQTLNPDMSSPAQVGPVTSAGLSLSNVTLTLPITSSADIHATGCFILQGSSADITAAVEADFRGCDFECSGPPALVFTTPPGIARFDDSSWFTYTKNLGPKTIATGRVDVQASSRVVRDLTAAVPAILVGGSVVVPVIVAELANTAIFDQVAIASIQATWQALDGPTDPVLQILGAWLSNVATGEVSIQFAAIAGAYAGADEPVSLIVGQQSA